MKLALVLVAMLAAGCNSATATPDPRTVLEGCSLLQFHGNLVTENGKPVIKTLGDWRGQAGTVQPDWPEQWTIHRAGAGQFEILDSDGSVRVRTGTHVILETSDYLNPYNGDGEFVVCNANPFGA